MKVIKNSLIYTVVSFFQRAISFLLLPLYTFYITPNDYGILNVLLSLSSFISVFILLSLNGAATRFHYEGQNDTEKIKKIWGTIFTFVFFNSLFVGLILFAFHQILIDPFTKGIEYYPYVFFTILNTILTPIYLFYQTYLQTIQDGKKYGLNLLANFTINVLLILLFVVKFKMGILGILYANLITTCLFLVYTFIEFFKRIIIGIDINLLKKSLKYSLPLLPHSLSGWTMAMVDRLIINNMIGSVQTGIYSIGYQFGNIINIITAAINQAYVPWFFQKLNEGAQGKNDIVAFAKNFTILFSFMAFSISFFSEDLLKLMVNSKYYEAWKVIPIIAFSFVFSGMYYFYVNVLFVNKTKYVVVVTLSSAVIGLILNLILIPKFNLFGAAFSSFVSYFFSCFFAMIFAKKTMPDLKFETAKMFTIVSIFCLISFLIYTPYIHEQLSLGLKIVIYFLILTSLFFALKKSFLKFFRQSILNSDNL